MKRPKIPVWIVTGYLGSGKTTLLKRWLRQPELAQAALIINEVGEVGFDDQILARSADSATQLLANQCICCNGLPGLQETLVELWWSRLRRERPFFDAVVIETTGLADPRPLKQLFELVPLLRERYALQAIVTVVSATAGCAGIQAHDEARMQLHAADAVVLTKMDRAPAVIAPLSGLIRSYAPQACILHSALASLEWNDLVSAVTGRPQNRPAPATPPPTEQAERTGLGFQPGYAPVGATAHRCETRFIPLPEPVALSDWEGWLGPRLGPGLLRLKGVVRLDQDSLMLIQWAQGDLQPSFEPFDGPCPPLGITEIRAR